MANFRIRQQTAGKPLTTDEVQERLQFYAEIGQAISIWARMESRIIHFAACLIDSDVQKTGVIFYSINFTVWLAIIEDLLLLDKHLANVRRMWTPVGADLRKLNNIRVRLAHHTTWQRSGLPPGLMPTHEDQRNRSRGYAPLTLADINRFVDGTTAMFQRIVEVQERLRSARIAI